MTLMTKTNTQVMLQNGFFHWRTVGRWKWDKQSETSDKGEQPSIVFMQAVFVEASVLHDWLRT